ncbi:MAG: pyridoxamine 5'-phosphate oxidase family protein [Proteobacteria bacterium]|nr:pyridoxamine 5'-phosphate oxidase family protein [Pseudomonadota bacterium]
MPIEKIANWIKEEKELGSQEAGSVVLATASSCGEVHSRIVAIRELTESGVLFFTQKRSRKAKDLNENPSASMTLWLPLQQREVVLDGAVKALDQRENEFYWEALPRERQLRFLTYKSGEPIDTLNTLQCDYEELERKFQNKKIPINECYCGYRLIPNRIYFYTLGQNTFSQVIEYKLFAGRWESKLVSP